MKPDNIDSSNSYVCISCGNQYLQELNYVIPKDNVATCHQGICKCCGKDTTVTHERAYRWLYYWQNDKKDETETTGT